MATITDAKLFDNFMGFLNDAHLQNVPVINRYVSYANYIQVDTSNRGEASLFEEYPDFWYIVALWTAGLVVVGLAVKYGSINLFPKWAEEQMKKVEDADGKEVYVDKYKARNLNIMHANVAAIIHHLIVVIVSLRLVYDDMNRTEEERATANYTREHGYLFAISQGYILGDFLAYAIPFKDVAMIIHHTLFLLLCWGLIFIYDDAPAYFTRYVPHSLLCETSGIFSPLVGMTLLNQAGVEFDALTLVFNLCFAFSFLLFRVISLPLVFLNILYIPHKLNPDNFIRGRSYYFLAAIIYPFIGMQFYWMYGIIRKAMKGNAKGRKLAGENKNKSSVGAPATPGTTNDNKVVDGVGNSGEEFADPKTGKPRPSTDNNSSPSSFSSVGEGMRRRPSVTTIPSKP